VDEYEHRLSLGEKWCHGCREWHERSYFGKDSTRYDGLAALCTQSRSQNRRRRYKPKPRPLPGRSFVPARDGDRTQARGRINYFVELGLIPRPNDIPCHDCGHIWKEGERRHEYDHYLGYAAEYHEHVQVVCTLCHAAREKKLRQKERQRNKLGQFI